MVIYTHGAMGDQKLDKCLSKWNLVPQVIRNLHNKKINNFEVKIYRLCSGVRGWSKSEQDKMWKHHEKTGKLTLKDNKGEFLITKQKQNQKLKVIENTINKIADNGFKNIILAGHSSGGWQSLKIQSNNDNLIDLKSPEDSFSSAANYLSKMGWDMKGKCFNEISLDKKIPIKYLNYSARKIKHKKRRKTRRKRHKKRARNRLATRVDRALVPRRVPMREAPAPSRPLRSVKEQWCPAVGVVTSSQKNCDVSESLSSTGAFAWPQENHDRLAI